MKEGVDVGDGIGVSFSPGTRQIDSMATEEKEGVLMMDFPVS